MNNGDDYVKEAVELYRCHPERGGGIGWAIIFLIFFGVPIYGVILEKNLWPLLIFWLPFGWYMLLCLEQTLWQLFGEEIGTMDDEYFYIHRKNRMFNRNWRIHLHKINGMDYYTESTFHKLFIRRGLVKNTLYIAYSPSDNHYNFAPGLPSDEQDEVLDRLEEAVTAAKEREGIKAEEEYWEAVEEFSCDDEGL
jgi:hypothetical protein